MLAAAVIAIVFTSMLVITWLTSRAEAAQTRCDDLARHIRHQLEIPPTGPGGAGRPERRIRR